MVGSGQMRKEESHILMHYFHRKEHENAGLSAEAFTPENLSNVDLKSFTVFPSRPTRESQLAVWNHLGFCFVFDIPVCSGAALQQFGVTIICSSFSDVCKSNCGGFCLSKDAHRCRNGIKK